MEEGRLVIRKVELTDFKSYGGTRVIGPFHDNFSAIVGPNGSGKSNIIDAMLFVFGRRANQLRQKKLSELIHNSAGKHPSTTCVAVHMAVVRMAKAGGWEEIEGSQFTVSREARRDNTSRYVVDGKTVTQKEMTTLLKVKGIDLEHNRFLILQGEVEHIAMMKPKGQSESEEGFLEYLEDIIGSSAYQPLISAEEEKLEECSSMLQEKKDRLQAAAKELEVLTGPRLEAEAYFKKERRILAVKSHLEQIDRLKLKVKGQAVQMQYDDNIAKWDSWKEQRKSQTDELAQAQTVMLEEKDKLHQAKRLLGKLENQFRAFERKDAEIQTKQKSITTRKRKHNDEIQKMDADAMTCGAQAEKAEIEIINLKEKIPASEAALEELTTEMEELEESLSAQLKDLRGKKESATDLLAPLQQEVDRSKANLSVLKARAQLLKEKQTRAAQAKSDKQEKIAEREVDLKAKTAQRTDSATLLAKKKKQIPKKSEELKKYTSKFEEENQTLVQQRAGLEEKDRVFKQAHMSTRCVSEILEAKERGDLPGVVDALWHLGSFRPKYEFAFSAVAASDTIVTNTTEDAQAVIGFVRQRGLGRVTCIVLDTVREELGRNMDTTLREEIPKNTFRLMDLIENCPEEYKIAFYFQLRDGLVTGTLDEARKAAFGGKKRWRVVTMEGQVVDKSGTITGGKVTKAFLKGSDRTSAQEIEMLRTKLRDAQAVVEGVRSTRNNLDQELQDLDIEIRQLETTIPALDTEIENLKIQIKHLGESLQDAKVPQLTDDEKKELEKVEGEISSLEKGMLKQEGLVNAQQRKIEEIETAMANVGGTKRKSLRDKLETTRADIATMKKGMEEWEMAARECAEKSRRAQEEIPRLKIEIEKETEAAAKLAEDREAMEDDAAACLKEKEDLEISIATQIKHLDVMEVNNKTLSESLRTIGLQEIEFQSTRDDLQEEIVKLESAIRKINKSLEKFQLDWDSVPAMMEEEPTNSGDGTLMITEEAEGEEGGPTTLNLDLPEEELEEKFRIDLEVRLQVIQEGQAHETPDMRVIEKYAAQLTKTREREAQCEEVLKIREGIWKKIENFSHEREEQFLGGFQVIAVKLKEMYQMITLGGDAELEFVDPANPFAEGIAFSVRPPRKSWKQIQNLSGGEKTLSSLALVFALHHYKPTALYFMDEIDAALDFRNVSIIANYIAMNSGAAQFIVISLRDLMYEKADRLVGIYKTHDVTDSCTLDPATLAAAE